MRCHGFGVVGQLDAVRGVPGVLLRALLSPWGGGCPYLGLDLQALGADRLVLAPVRTSRAGDA